VERSGHALTLRAGIPLTSRAPRFPLFDSLRAIAALSIVLLHALWYAGAFEGDAIRDYAGRLDVGVTVFFAISGFLLYRPFVQAHVAGEDPLSARAYAWRRFLRIVPAYWVLLAVVAVVLGTGGIAQAAAFLQLYDGEGISPALGPTWTLCVEVSFYAFLPLFAVAVRRLARGAADVLRVEIAAVAGLIALSVLYKLALFASGALDGVTVLDYDLIASLPGSLDQFAAGMLLACLSVRAAERDEESGSGAGALPWLVAAGAFVLSANVGLPAGLYADFTPAEWLTRNLLYVVVAVGLVLPAIFGDPDRGAVRRLLGWRPLLWTGLVSYGLYLYHVPVSVQARDWGLADLDLLHPYARWTLAALAGGLALAALSYYLVERPALRLKDRVGEAPRGPAAREAVSEAAPAAPRSAGS
jgi:peptidoglycan/LPS O-acetylase OafA/YrhL